ncbi:MAG TPA: c-type cytochrome [Parafilimonas sp.]|nr:c-type cytochrome [Parafilimonas sp.]
MKFKFVIPALCLLAACSSGTGKTEASDSANATQAVINTGGTSVDSAENISGNNLIASNDCLTCHKINEKNIGPSYKQIAEKYELNQGNIENLANKIIKGGKGLWGDPVMTPHPNVSEIQAQEMARYILSLRNASDTAK